MFWHRNQKFKFSTAVWNSLTIFSQFLHCLFGGKKWYWLFHGEPDLTVSSRLYIESIMGSKNAEIWKQRVDKLFFFDEDHCRKSFDRDSSLSGRVKQIRGIILRKLK